MSDSLTPTPKPRKLKTKVVLVGGVGVGKTSIVFRFVKEDFNEFSQSTIGASFMVKRLAVDDCEVEFAVWDTAGQEQYHSLVPLYFRKAACVIVVHDVTSASSFQESKAWIGELETQAPRGVLIAIVGNKCDKLVDTPRAVTLDDVREFAQKSMPESEAIIIETSAKDGTGVASLFQQIGTSVIERYDRNVETDDESDEVDFSGVGRTPNRERGRCPCG